MKLFARNSFKMLLFSLLAKKSLKSDGNFVNVIDGPIPLELCRLFFKLSWKYRSATILHLLYPSLISVNKVAERFDGIYVLAFYEYR